LLTPPAADRVKSTANRKEQKPAQDAAPEPPIREYPPAAAPKVAPTSQRSAPSDAAYARARRASLPAVSASLDLPRVPDDDRLSHPRAEAPRPRTSQPQPQNHHHRDTNGCGAATATAVAAVEPRPSELRSQPSHRNAAAPDESAAGSKPTRQQYGFGFGSAIPQPVATDAAATGPSVKSMASMFETAAGTGVAAGKGDEKTVLEMMRNHVDLAMTLFERVWRATYNVMLK
jgi:hypothetical protein